MRLPVRRQPSFRVRRVAASLAEFYCRQMNGGPVCEILAAPWRPAVRATGYLRVFAISGLRKSSIVHPAIRSSSLWLPWFWK